VETGAHFARHPALLGQLRGELRGRWRDSPGRRADVIAAALEAAFRRMWKRWCAELPTESFIATGAAGVAV